MAAKSSKPNKPSAAHRKLAIFVGTWRANGTSYAAGQRADDAKASTTPWRSTESFEWLPGEFFLLHRWDATVGKQSFIGTEIFGYDEKAGGYFTRFFDNMGNHPEYRVTRKGRVWTFNEPNTRATVMFDRAGDRMELNWEWKNGRKWMPLCDIVAEKTK